MRRFVVGIIVGALLLTLVVFGYFLAGQAPVATDAAPMPFEKYLAKKALHGALDREMPHSVSIPADDPNFERTPYEPFVAYGRSKTANILFAVAFDKRHWNRGVRAAAVHPRGIRTELGRYVEPGRIEK
jgi:NAD(P)-dependent dehydrogenase (short-subunit alcohol dehydrogenase family)